MIRVFSSKCSEELYEIAVRAIPSLLSILKDTDDKAKANAAGIFLCDRTHTKEFDCLIGTLGNLIRNSGKLSDEIRRHGVVAALLEVSLLFFKITNF